MLALIVGITFPLLLIAAAYKDATSMTIPNWISLALVASFVVAAPFAMSWSGMALNVGVALGALAIGFAMFALNWLGGGDAKLIASAALWLGWGALPEFLLWTALAGGGLSLTLLAARKAVEMAPIAAGSGPLARLLTPKGDIPYGLAIAAGGLGAFPSSAIFIGAVG